MSEGRDAAAVHKRAFAHYLRTGERLTSGEWLAKQEWKFNPYHDVRGRFTSPPGVTVSWGKYGRAYGDPERAGHRGKRSTSASSDNLPRPFESGKPAPAVAAPLPTGVSGGFNSEFVRDATTPGGHAETYFELNKRQAGLDRLRDAAGPKPGAKVQADLREIQKRLDADRVRLDARQVEVDRQPANFYEPDSHLTMSRPVRSISRLETASSETTFRSVASFPQARSSAGSAGSSRSEGRNQS